MISKKTPVFGLGWIENLPDDRDYNVDKLGLSAPMLTKYSLRPYVTEVLNQKNTSSCVAQMIAGAIDVIETKNGHRYSPVSRLFLYYNSRAYHYSANRDAGTYIRTCVKGLKKYGVPNEEHWEFSTDPKLISRRPGWNPYAMAHARKDGTYHWILDHGQARVEKIMSAIANGYPVGFGTKVTKDFLNKTGPNIEDRPADSAEIAGGHAMLIVGYKVTSGGVLFEILNSWGRSWRDGGFASLTESYIQWPETRDFCIIHGWDRINS